MPEARPGSARTQTLGDKDKDEQMKAYEEEMNTKMWAKAILVDGTKQPKPQKPEAKVDMNHLSHQEYEKLFHQATLQANGEVETKSFE